MSRKLVLLLTFFLLLSCLIYLRIDQVDVKAPNGVHVHNLDTGLNYTTIQAAIDAPETLNGHTIFVDNGTYYEHVIITKSLMIIGENGEAAIIDGGGTRTVVQVATNNVSLINLTVRNAGKTVTPRQLDSCIRGKYVSNICVQNSTLSGAAVCLWFDHSSSINITANNVFDGMFAGIINYAVRNATVCGNFVHDYVSDGIHLDGGSRFCQNGNNTVQNGFLGISLEIDPDSAFATASNMIDGNRITNNSLAGIGIWKCGTNTFQRNNMTGNKNSLVVWGFTLSNFMQDVDTSNTANNKTIYYLTNRTNLIISPSGYPNLGDLILVNCTNTVINYFDLSSNGDGMLLAGSVNCTLTNITIEDNRQPLIYGGFPFIYGGLTFFESNNNTIVENRICNNSYGICLYHSDWNIFYHNSFVNNSKNVISDYFSPFQNISSGHFSTNLWDNGFEGNYWSEYKGTDLFHGTLQNEEGSDGIGDTPYEIDENNTDHYPLMGMFHDFTVPVPPYPTGETEQVDVISNSTVSSLGLAAWLTSPNQYFQPGQLFITVSVAGEDGTFGFCRLMIPRVVLNSSSYIVLVDWHPVNVTMLPISNNTHAYLYFTYVHSNCEVIMAMIPEFSLFFIPLFLIATLLTVTTCRKQHQKRRIET